MDWLSDIKKICSIVEEWNLAQHFIALKDFYIHPKRFWKRYNRLSRKDKIYQFITYFAIFAIIALGCNGYAINDIFKLVAPIAQFAFITIVLIGGYCLLYHKEGICISAILTYSSYYLFLIVPIGTIFAAAYYATGSYHILFLLTITDVIMQLYLWIMPSIIFLSTKKERIIAIISIFIVLNVAEVVMYPFHNNISASNYPNYINNERYELGKSLRNAYTVPHYVVTNKRNTEHFYLFAGPTDSLTHSTDTTQYFEQLAADMDYLRTVSDKCRYEENKIFFSQLFDIRRCILHCHQHHQYSNEIAKETVVVNADKQEIDRYFYQLFNADVLNLNNKLYEIEIKDAQAYELATLPLTVNIWMRPALMLVIKYDNQN